MKEKKVIVYEGEVKDGWGGISLGGDSITSISEKLESFLDSGRKIKVKIEYDIVYEGEVKDGWGGISLGGDSITSISEKLESFLDSGRKIKVKIEYDEDA